MIERVADAVQCEVALRADVDQGPAQASVFLGFRAKAGGLVRRTWLQVRVAVETRKQCFFGCADARPARIRWRANLGEHGAVECDDLVGQRVGNPR